MAPFVVPVSAPSGPKEDQPDTNTTYQVGFALPADRQHPDVLTPDYVLELVAARAALLAAPLVAPEPVGYPCSSSGGCWMAST